MPELERDELASSTRRRGWTAPPAPLATQVMADPQRCSRSRCRRSSRSARSSTPFREGWVTGLATAVGALIPVFPFLVTTGMTAMVLSFALAMASHFLVGAARSWPGYRMRCATHSPA